ncbi:CaiB/BaiF CoA transferase family protein [Hellea balneolensis]|uniref:CaiB/BaiF CoA transferase family protein n=1 Tax=Hellea balneolensis TaxID=287478 RepID=UPI00041AD0CE|nr:CaiB/BaiF CoA-transferase family protein [Hellea balneolensis]
MTGVLSGIKVLDLSWGIAGPMTGMLLADHGADVTRIERPQGDPFGDLLGYRVWHRGKKNAVLDFHTVGDLGLFKKLAADADVLIESMRPGKMKEFGLDYDQLAKLNPKLIYCSISGYGDDDDRPGYDALVAASSGLQFEQRGWAEGALNHMAGREDPFAGAAEIDPNHVQGANREGPLHVASKWPSMGAFFSAITGISAALFAREKTGRGQRVTTSLQQGAMACGSGVWQRAEDIDAQGFNTWIMGSASPKGHFKCADDKWLHNWVPNPRFILEASKGDTLDASPDLSVQNDPDRFGIGPEELLVMAHYQPILADAVKKFKCDDWVKAAADGNMTMQPCRNIEESLTDPLLLNDNCVVTIDDPELGPINQVGITYRLSNSQGAIQGPMRVSGADTEAVKAYAASLTDAHVQKAPAQPTGKGPLDGIRVLDLGLAIAGPFGCQLLADMGAEVIKMNTLWDSYWHRCHIAYMANRGKKSLAVMLKHPKGMEAIKKVIATCDVVQHNMRYPATQRLGLDYDSLKEEFPHLIYCHSRGFEEGPRKNLPGNDQTGACLAGVQHEDGALHAGGDTHPMWSLTSLGDTGNGFLTAVGICNALMERERTGKGQFVDTSIVNACLLNTSYAVAKPDGSAVARERLNADQTGYGDYYRLYECSDGVWIQVAAISEAHKAALDEVAGQDKIASFKAATSDVQMKVLADATIPAAISDAEASRRLFDNEDYKAKGWTAEYHHPYVGKLEQIGLTYNLSDTPGVIGTAPLIVGDCTKAILEEIGYSEEEILAMANETAILCDPPLPGQKEMKNPWGL